MRKNTLTLITFLLFVGFEATSQTIYGTIKSHSNDTIHLVNLNFVEKNTSKIKDFATIRSKNYSVQLKNKYDTLIVKVNSSGYTPVEFIFINPNEFQKYKLDITLEKSLNFELKEFTVKSKRVGIEEKGDTLVYNVASFKTGEEKKIEEIIRKLPGIDVDDKTGTIKYKGKPIQTVNLDGDNLFGANYIIGTRNINVDIVDKIEAIENYFDNPLLKNVSSEEAVALNLVLKKGKYDFSGNIDLGIGAFSNKKPTAFINANVLGVNEKLKLFGVQTFNNLGVDLSPFQSINRPSDNNTQSPKIISDKPFIKPFPELRSNFNNQILSNLNILFKLGNRSSIKVNSFFINDKIINETYSLNAYYFSDSLFQTSDLSKNKSTPRLIQHQIAFKNYYSEKSIFESNFDIISESNTSYVELLKNNKETNNYKTKSFQPGIIWDGMLSYKLKTSSLLQFFSQINIDKAPQSINFSDLAMQDSLMQNSLFQKKGLKNEIRLLGTKSSYFWNLRLQQSFQSVSFDSSPIWGETNTNSSNLEVNNYKFHSELSKRYNKFRFNFIGEISNVNQSLKGDTLLASSNFIFEPTLSVIYQLGKFSNISLNISQNYKTINEAFIFTKPVIVDNRKSVSNIPDLSLMKLHKLGLNFNKHDIFNQFSISSNFVLQKSFGSYQGSYHIDSNYVIMQNFFSNKESNIITSNFSVEKFIPGIFSNFKIELSYFYQEYQNILNENMGLRFNKSRFFSHKFLWRTSFDLPINMENAIYTNISNSKNSYSEPMINTSWSYISKLFWNSQKYPFNINLISEIYNPNKNQNKILWYLDFSGNYDLSSRSSISLSINNILNQNQFVVNNPSDYGLFQLKYALLPRHFTIGYSLQI